MRRNAHVLLLCAVVAALCLAPAQPRTSDLPVGISAPEWQPMASGATCEGECDGQEVSLGCGTSSATGCCNQIQSSCTHFNGICSGDAEILCAF